MATTSTAPGAALPELLIAAAAAVRDGEGGERERDAARDRGEALRGGAWRDSIQIMGISLE